MAWPRRPRLNLYYQEGTPGVETTAWPTVLKREGTRPFLYVQYEDRQSRVGTRMSPRPYRLELRALGLGVYPIAHYGSMQKLQREAARMAKLGAVLCRYYGEDQ